MRRPVWVLPGWKPQRQVYSWQGLYVILEQTKKSMFWTEELSVVKSGSSKLLAALTSRSEPSHEIMALFVLRKLMLQTCMHSHQVGLISDFWSDPFVCFHNSCVRKAKALARLRGYAGLPEPSLVAYVVSTIISWAGSFLLSLKFVYVAPVVEWLSMLIFSTLNRSSLHHWVFEPRSGQVLLTGGQVFFLRNPPFSLHLMIDLAQNEWNNLDGT